MSQASAMGPQEWWEVVAPPPTVAAATAELIPRRGDLDVGELEELAVAIAGREDIWRPMLVVDASRRRYRLIYEDEHLDVWVLFWMPGQGTGFHDHDVSGVGLAAAQGMVLEKQLLLPAGHTTVELRPGGESRRGPAGYIHSVAHGVGTPAITIHCYSPPLVRVGQYRVDDHGVLCRRTEHGRQELLDHTVRAVAPELA